MKVLQPLCNFFKAVQSDGRISVNHIGGYAALLDYRARHSMQNPVRTFSHEIMALAKITSNFTYYKCIRELSEYGYINYTPSYKKTKASRIYFLEG
ncbi:hypothetical protein GR160_03635 [Flavobacterium sp. Sd200]|nr:hypothetical protein [Flavobacterium sp. Sd200]MXN90307.1 hypothetical protein [Flavobacterium sp. Sd200]